MTFMHTFSPQTIQGVARHVRKMLGSIKSRPKNLAELAYALTAAKIVVSVLERACGEAGVDTGIGDELVEDGRAVMDLVGWAVGGRR